MPASELRGALRSLPDEGGFSCHCEERSDAAISVVVPNLIEIPSLCSQ